MQIQNQSGTRPLKWHNTGYITETLPHRQYRVVVDGSRRITLRNRRFLKKILPVCRKAQENSYDHLTASPPTTTTENVPRTPDPSTPVNPIQPEQQNEPENPPLRRSTRERRAPHRLMPTMKGPYHD